MKYGRMHATDRLILPGMLAHACNFRTLGGRGRRSFQAQKFKAVVSYMVTPLHSDLGDRARPCLKKEKEKEKQKQKEKAKAKKKEKGKECCLL